MAKSSAPRDTRLTLRLPANLRTAIGKCAAAERRSVSNWIVLQLEAAVAAAAKEPKR